MRKGLNWLFLVCGTLNAIHDAHAWYAGDAATGITWLFAVLFSVNVALTALEELTDAK
jgi:hypothetical protein